MKKVSSHAALPQFFPLVRRHSFKMLFTFAIVMGLAVAYTAMSPVLYTSESKLFVRLGRETLALDPTATTGQTVSFQETRETEINSIYELLKSRSLVEQLVDVVGTDAILGKSTGDADEAISDDSLARPIETPGEISIWKQLNPLTTYSVRDKAIRKLSQRLRVDAVRKSNIINLSCDATDPLLAQTLVTKAIDLAKTMHMRVNRTVGSFDFFATQSEEQARQLAVLEDRRRDLKNQTGIASVDDQRAILQKRIATLEDDRLRASAALAAARADAIVRSQTLADLPANHVTSATTGQPQTAASRMREQLYSLELKEKELSAKFQEDTFFVQQVREQIAAARAVLAKEVEPVETTTSLNQAHHKTHVAMLEGSARVASLEAESKTLDQQLADARAAMATFNNAEIELVRIGRQIEQENASFVKFVENRELARIDQALQEHSISNLNVLQPPTYSITPTKPRVIVNLALGFVLALIASFGGASLSEFRRRTSAPAFDPLERTTWHDGDSSEPESMELGELHLDHWNGHENGNGALSPAERGVPR